MLRIDKFWAVLVVFLVSWSWVLPGTDCFGQGFLLISEHDHPIRLPRPLPPHPPIERPNPEVLYRVKHLEVDTRIRDSIARVQLSQRSSTKEAKWLRRDVWFLFLMTWW